MADTDPFRRPDISFYDWCIRKARQWHAASLGTKDRDEITFCEGEREKYLRALEVARGGFHV